MNSTNSNPHDRQKLACYKGLYYLAPNPVGGKKTVYVERKPQMEPSEPKAVRSYDESYLFHLFCCANGRMPEFFRLIEALPNESKLRIPKASTLYKIANESDWRARFEEIRGKMRENLEAQNGLPYTKIDQLAAYVLQGTLMKFVLALKQEKYGDFSVKDLRSLWHMSRTERGLAPTVPFGEQNQEKYGEQVHRIQELKKRQDSTAGSEFYDRLEGLSSEELKLFTNVLTGGSLGGDPDDGIPNMIRKK